MSLPSVSASILLSALMAGMYSVYRVARRSVAVLIWAIAYTASFLLGLRLLLGLFVTWLWRILHSRPTKAGLASQCSGRTLPRDSAMAGRE